MIKLREAHYCNLKLLLMFLVIYGHLIEPQIWRDSHFMLQYRWIYLVHMPLFAFLSGLFINNQHSCVIQLKKMIPLYFFLQVTIFLIGNGKVKLLIPFWHLWYLLSYACWLGIAGLWFCYGKGKRKFLILTLSFVFGCLAGCIDAIGRVLSLSRTIVFFPYFWLGIILDGKIEWKKYRLFGIFSLLLSAIVIYFMQDKISISFLYQTDPYEIKEKGLFLRLLCYMLGILLGFFLLTWMPNKRYSFTKVGGNTLPVYLLHIPFVVVLREFNGSCFLYMIFSIMLLWLIYKLFQWKSFMVGIVSKKGGIEHGYISRYL